MQKYTSVALALLVASEYTPLAAQPIEPIQQVPPPQQIEPPQQTVPTREIVPSGRIASMVRVRDLQGDFGEIRGTLVNLTDDELRDVRLLVRDMFLWHNERNPGVNDPSQSQEFTVAGPVPPRGSVPFTIPRASVPARGDGAFTTTVEVTALTQQPLGGQPSTHRAVPLGTTNLP